MLSAVPLTLASWQAMTVRLIVVSPAERRIDVSASMSLSSSKHSLEGVRMLRSWPRPPSMMLSVMIARAPKRMIGAFVSRRACRGRSST